jgi:phage terminase small subunit
MMTGRKLKRSEIVQALESMPIDSVLVGVSSKGTPRALTAKQKRFAEAIAMGETKAGAYRKAYDTQGKPETQSHSGSRLVADPRVAAQIDAFRVAAEARKYATPAALRSLVIEQLTAMAVNPDVKDAQRLRALELLGKVTEVAAFTERREVVKVTGSGDARDRLIESLRVALRAAPIDAEVVGESLLAELAGNDDAPNPTHDANAPGATRPEGAPLAEAAAAPDPMLSIPHTRSSDPKHTRSPNSGGTPLEISPDDGNGDLSEDPPSEFGSPED